MVKIFADTDVVLQRIGVNVSSGDNGGERTTATIKEEGDTKADATRSSFVKSLIDCWYSEKDSETDVKKESDGRAQGAGGESSDEVLGLNMEKIKEQLDGKRTAFIEALVRAASLRGNADARTSEMDTMLIARRAVESELAESRSRVAQCEAELTVFRKETEPKIVELQVLRRRVHKAETEAAEAVKAATLAAETAAAAGSKPEASGGGGGDADAAGGAATGAGADDAEMARLREDIELLEKKLESSMNDIAKLAEERRIDERNAAATLREQTHGMVSAYTIDAERNRGNALERELNRMKAEVDQLRKDRMDMMTKERENDLMRKDLESLHAQYTALDNECHKCKAQVTQVISERDEAKLRLAKELDASTREASSSSVAELKKMLTTMETEAAALRAELQRANAAKGDVVEAQKQVASAREEVNGVVASQVAVTRERMRACEDRLKEVERERDDALLKVRQLRSIEAALELLGPFGDEEKKVVAATNGHNAETTKARAAVDAAKRETLTAREKAAEASAKATLAQEEVKRAQAELISKDGEITAFAQEMEDMAGAYEDMRAQNSRLLATISENTAAYSTTVGEKVQAELLRDKAQHKASLCEERCVNLDASLQAERSRISTYARESEKLLAQMATTGEELRQREARIDSMSLQEQQLLGRVAVLEQQLETAKENEEAAVRREAQAAGLAEKERRKRQRRDEYVEVLRKRGAHSVDMDEGLDDDETELQLYKRMILCGVCEKRNKDTIITKCFHMFCRSCLEENLATRLRKCPTCGLSFGQNDIQEVFM